MLQSYSPQLYQKETPTEVFSYEFSEITHNNIFLDRLQVTMSEMKYYLAPYSAPYSKLLTTQFLHKTPYTSPLFQKKNCSPSIAEAFRNINFLRHLFLHEVRNISNK